MEFSCLAGLLFMMKGISGRKFTEYIHVHVAEKLTRVYACYTPHGLLAWPHIGSYTIMQVSTFTACPSLMANMLEAICVIGFNLLRSHGTSCQSDVLNGNNYVHCYKLCHFTACF